MTNERRTDPAVARLKQQFKPNGAGKPNGEAETKPRIIDANPPPPEIREDGAPLLNEIKAIYQRYLILPEGGQKP